jgi:copper chaperone CopZ
MRNTATFAIPAVLGLLILSGSTQAADQKFVLMLAGNGCESHLDDVAKALTAVKGVTGVDLKSMKGHAVVSQDGSVKVETLVAAVKSLKGSQGGAVWQCDAMLMD